MRVALVLAAFQQREAEAETERPQSSEMGTCDTNHVSRHQTGQQISVCFSPKHPYLEFVCACECTHERGVCVHKCSPQNTGEFLRALNVACF